MQLINRADGVNGHFCIGQYDFDGGFWEFWTEHSQSFTSAGTVYVGEEVAQGKLNLLHQQRVKLKDRFTAGLSCQVARIHELEAELLKEFACRQRAEKTLRQSDAGIANLTMNLDSVEQQLKDNHDRAEEIIKAREVQIERMHTEINNCKKLAKAILEL